MAIRSLSANHLAYTIIRSEDIRSGALKDYSLLFVPGGWASNKQKALGKEGAEEIRKFVKAGGCYLGICGGAGLATQDGLGLIDVSRKSGSLRLPSFSGEIELKILSDDRIWSGTDSKVFNAWWPSQFALNDKSIKVHALFGDALSSSFSSDLNVGDVQESGSWQELESIYGINLDPVKLKGEPAVVEASFGRGRVILSLVHFDSVDDANGANVLKNIFAELGILPEPAEASAIISSAGSKAAKRLEAIADYLMEFGLRNFLWFGRNSMLIQWRRGIRGLEYCTLYQLSKEIAVMLGSLSMDEQAALEPDLNGAITQLEVFVRDVKELLYLERLQMQQGVITYEKCSCAKTHAMRLELFGLAKSHGGRFKEAADLLDKIVFKLIKNR